MVLEPYISYIGCIESHLKKRSVFVVINDNYFAGFVATNSTKDITIPTQPIPEPVMSVFGWIIIHQRLGLTFNWNLSWVHYKDGFGSTDGNFWLGLEKVHLLTNCQLPYRLRVELQQRDTELWFSAEYWSFKIGDKYWSRSVRSVISTDSSRSVTSTGHSRSVTSTGQDR